MGWGSVVGVDRSISRPMPATTRLSIQHQLQHQHGTPPVWYAVQRAAALAARPRRRMAGQPLPLAVSACGRRRAAGRRALAAACRILAAACCGLLAKPHGLQLMDRSFLLALHVEAGARAQHARLQRSAVEAGGLMAGRLGGLIMWEKPRCRTSPSLASSELSQRPPARISTTIAAGRAA